MIRTNIDIQHLNSFGLPCLAAGFCQVGSLQALTSICEDAGFKHSQRLILGGGSNVVLAGDFPGLVVQPDWHGIQIIDQDSQSVTVSAGASEVWHKLVIWSVEQGYYGLENLAAIPGWCGAAPMQNIGAYGAEFSDVCTSVSYIDLDTLSQHSLTSDQCQFDYRTSIFKKPTAQNWLVTGITLRLQRQGNLNLDYPGVAEMLQRQNIQQPAPADVAAVITAIRQQKLPDPEVLGNAGSFFKNPIVSTNTVDAIRALHPDMPHWATGNKIKLSAAWLIEQCGWKGHRKGPVGVHRDHALVLVHYGNGSGRQLLELADCIKQDVFEQFGIDLQPEPKIIQN